MANCLCDHPEDDHRARPINGRWHDPCQRCECTVFQEVEEPAEPPSTLIYAWDSWLCTSCEWRTSADVKACLQCGSRLAPVRLEMHSREPL